MDNLVEILVNLGHYLHFALLDFLAQLGALTDQELSPTAKRIQVRYNLCAVLLQYVN